MDRERQKLYAILLGFVISLVGAVLTLDPLLQISFGIFGIALLIQLKKLNIP